MNPLSTSSNISLKQPGEGTEGTRTSEEEEEEKMPTSSLTSTITTTSSSSSSSSSNSSNDRGLLPLPSSVTDAVLVPTSMTLPEDTPIVEGYDFNAPQEKMTLDNLLQSYVRTGFQATNFGYAIEEIQNMLQWRLSDRDISLETDDDYKDVQVRHYTRCTIFLSYTSNLVSAGIRESIRYLVQHHLVDVLVTTAGGIEEDFIKCLAPTYLGDFNLKGKELRMQGMNRIGNLLVPNSNYCKFEDWIIPIFYKMAEEQAQANEKLLELKKSGKDKNSLPIPFQWTPSKVIHRLGKEINHESSIYYWAYKNNIPVFCPALTDGSLGDMLYFFSYKNPSFTIDIVSDIRRINDIAVRSKCSGMIILGGGLVKHHTCNANLMRNGADYSVFVNTGQEFDGSDSGARPDEAISWGKIKIDSRPVKLYADASLVFPLLISQTFAKVKEERTRERIEKQKFMKESGKGKTMIDIYGEFYSN